MKLLVDIGNSRIKWAVSSAGNFVAQGQSPLAAELAAGLLAEDRQGLTEIRVANVAGARAGQRVGAALQARYGLAPVFALSAAEGADVVSGYTDAAQLGVDRWLAICAGFHRYRAPMCVVDAGTATTVDVVSGGGRHAGGLILPGIDLMQAALRQGTGDLDRLSTTDGRSAGDRSSVAHKSGAFADGRMQFAGDTAQAIRYGALHATTSLVQHCIESMRDGRLADDPGAILLLTGGAVGMVQTALLGSRPFMAAMGQDGLRLEVRPNLVLEGLALEPPCFLEAK